jgi:predicted nucleotide-binding protein
VRSTKERFGEMLHHACLALLVMTAEDEHADQRIHAGENVIHEAGPFQGRLGFNKAIILLEEGCEPFSNIHGLTQIRFPKGHIMSISEEIRRVLERERIL